MESQPQNPEFRNNPKNFHPCSSSASFSMDGFQTQLESGRKIPYDLLASGVALSDADLVEFQYKDI